MADYLSVLDDLAKEYGIPAAELRAIYQLETGSGSNVRTSPAGAGGQMQLMPGTAREMGVSNINDPMQNLRGGVKYYAQQRQRFGDPVLAAAAYNAGPGRVARTGGVPNIAETQNYVANFRRLIGSQPVTQGALSVKPASTGSEGSHTVDETDTTDGTEDTGEDMGFGALTAPFKALDAERMSLAFNRAKQFQDAKQQIASMYAAPTRADLMGALGQALLAPRPYGGFAGTLYNVNKALGGFSQREAEARQQRQQALAQLNATANAETNKEVANALAMKYRALTAQALANAKAAAAKPRTGFNPVTGQLVNMDTNEPIQPEIPTLTPKQVAVLARDPNNRGRRFRTTDGREMEIR